MITTPVVEIITSRMSRRTLYRQSKRLLARVLAHSWKGPRNALEPAVRRFLRARPRSFLLRLAGDRAFALAAAAAVLATPAAEALPPVNLSDVVAGSGGFVINGIDLGDSSGWSVSGAGDVNGDGLADLLVGAPTAGPGFNYAGESYVVFGRADGTPVELADVAAGSGGFVINGIGTLDFSGRSVSGAGDVNGDGLADVIVAELYCHEYCYGGDSYVVFGKADGTPVELADVAAGVGGGFLINGAPSYGITVSDAGDVNGDGLADVIVGSTGRSHVVFGKAGGTPVQLTDVAAGIGGFVINGSGHPVSGAGDVNGDGLDDLIVGVPGYVGESYVVFGKADGTPVELADVAAGSGGFVINGIDSGDSSGYSVSGAGDVNGDGLADVIVGALNADPGGNNSAGESYVVFGKADGVQVNLSDVAAGSGGFIINGIDPDDRSGRSVSGAGDVNGDGLADVIVGARGADPNGIDRAGESYVVFGKADGTAVNLSDVVACVGGFVIIGIDAVDFSGGSVSGAGDVNGDGRADLIVGARGADPGGESYVVFSRACPWDLDGGGTVGIDDFQNLLAAWGTDPGGPPDFDGDGDVGIRDFLELLANWGPCPLFVENQ